jgi:hypothetical protein
MALPSAGPFPPAGTATMKKPPDIYDGKEGYCRLLGHHLRFAYCRSCQDGYPCYKILDCWFEVFDIRKFVEDRYPPEEIERFLQKPRPKMQTLLSLIQQARERMKDK